MKIRSWLALGAVAIIMVLAGCSREDPSIIARPLAEAPDNDTEAQTLEVATATAGLAFAQTELTAKANQPIVVNFTNEQALPHNWVLVHPGQEEAVAQAAAADQGDATGVEEAIAAGEVIASSSETIEVDPLEADTYSYICTVPGHYAAGMVGTLTVEP